MISKIQLKDVGIKFEKQYLFSNINKTFERGKFYMISGKSGTGKSTLLSIISLLQKPTIGEIIYYDNEKEYSRKEFQKLRRNDFAYIFQDFALINDMSIKENLNLIFENKRKEEELKKSLIEVGLNKSLNTKISTLSGGEQQRVSIARVLLKNPSVIFADEPTGSLDDENRDIIISLIKKMQNKGTIIIMVTHDMEIKKYADDFYEM